MKINDLSAFTDHYRSNIEKGIARVISRGWYVLGPEVENFEKSFAEYIGVRRCIGVANGTDAIELGLRALGLGVGDLIATVANAGGYATNAILSIGSTPFYMDVDLDSYLVKMTEIEKAIEAGAKAIVVTHLFGMCVPEIQRIANICKERHIFLLEDCAQAHGSCVDSKKAGSFGDLGCFSFYPTKNLGALGDGGAITTNSEAIANTVVSLRQYGWTSKYNATISGGRNSRLDEFQAAILNELLPFLDVNNSRRREIADLYKVNISNPSLISLPTYKGAEYVAHLFVLRCANRDALKGFLDSSGIASEIHYPIPDFKQQYMEISTDLKLANTELLASQILTLPCHPLMSAKDTSLVINTVNQFR